MIQVEHLTKLYTDKANTVKALDDVSFTLPSTGLVFVLGKSGCGKTTLLNMLGGIDSPTEGDIKINGKSINTKKEKELDNYRNNYVGFVFQEFNLLTNYTVGSNIALALQLQRKKATREIIDDILRRVELVDADNQTLYDRKISELSGGQKQRVAIARALIKEPQIILADEPTGALDSETSASLFNLLKELSKDKLIVVVSHDRESAENYGDRIIELKDGKIISDTNPNEEYNLTSEQTININKGKLPLSRVFTMGAAGFKKKTFRLVISVILAVFSLSVFVFAVTALNFDLNMSELKTAYDNGGKSVTLTPYEERTTIVVSSVYSNENTRTSTENFTQEQLDLLSEQTNIYPIVSMNSNTADEYLYTDNLTISQLSNLYVSFSNNFISRYVVVDENTDASDLGLSPITDSSRLPLNSEEIAITDYHADMFARLGYRNIEEDAVEEINSPEEMIGKKIYDYTIVGIYSTEESLEWLKQYDKSVSSESETEYFNYWSYGYHMIKSALIGSDGLDLSSISQVLYMLTGNASNDKKIIESLYYEEETEEVFEGYILYHSIDHTITVTSAYTGFLSNVTILTEDIFLEAALIVGIVVAIFSALLLTNFLFVITGARKREIGILRALGATKLDTIKICLAEGAMVGIVDFCLSIIAGAIICLVMNITYNFHLFSIGILPVLYLFLLCFGTVALATILPTLKISRQRPIDIIRE